jgi:hypothetical protein
MIKAPGRQTPTIAANERTTQLVAHEDRHIGRVQTRQALTDGKHLDEFLVVDPMPLGYETAAKIWNHTAEAGGSDDQELEEYLAD